MFDLEALIEDLRRATRAVGSYGPAPFKESETLLDLPRYSLVGPTTGAALLAEDAQRHITSDFDDIDEMFLTILFRIKHADLSITDRHHRIAEATFMNERKVRGEHQTWLLARLAFMLYRDGISPVYDGVSARPRPPYTHRHMAYTVHVDADNPRRRHHRYDLTVESLRPGTRVYTLGRNTRGDRSHGLRLVSEDRGHIWLREVPMDTGDPHGIKLAFAYFGRALSIGDLQTISFEETIDVPDAAPYDSVNAWALNTDCQISVRVHAPRSIAPMYRRIHHLALDDMAREDASEEIRREDDSPMTYDVVGEEGHRYQLWWQLGPDSSAG